MKKSILTPCVNQIKGRTLRVDHVKDYRPPKDSEDIDDVTKLLREEGCAPIAPASSSSEEEDEQNPVPAKKLKKGDATPCFIHFDHNSFVLYCNK